MHVHYSLDESWDEVIMIPKSFIDHRVGSPTQKGVERQPMQQLFGEISVVGGGERASVVQRKRVYVCVAEELRRS